MNKKKGRDHDIKRCYKRYQEDGSKFLLTYSSVQRIIGCRSHESHLIFNNVFDTQLQGKVDSMEFLSALIIASQMSQKEKINCEFIYYPLFSAFI
jgi:hypothetical protein